MYDIILKNIDISYVYLLRETAIPSYADHYTDLWHDNGSWYVEKSFSLKQLTKELEDTNARFYLIYLDNKPVGFLKINIHAPLDGEDNALELERIYLKSNSTGKGVGKYVIEYVTSLAKELNKKIIWLKVMDSSGGAISFYKKMGFEICGKFRLDFEMMKEELRGMLIMKKSI